MAYIISVLLKYVIFRTSNCIAGYTGTSTSSNVVYDVMIHCDIQVIGIDAILREYLFETNVIFLVRL